MRSSLVCLLVLGSAASSYAGNPAADFASGAGNVLFLAAGVGLPLLRDDGNGRTHALRTFDALTTAVVATEALKRATRVPRPDTGTHDSFPSGHASAAFAVATMQASFHPREAPLWYLGAGLIGQSRLSLNRHRLPDVLAGAALGYGAARLELSSRRGILIAPFVGAEGGFGLVASGRF